MYSYKIKKFFCILSFVIFIVALFLCYKSPATAQNWIALPVYPYNPFLQGGYYVWNIPLVNEIVAGTPYFLSAYDLLGYNPNFSTITASDL